MYTSTQSKSSQKPPLSEKEKAIFEYLSDHFQSHGLIPTRQQIAENFEFRSANSAQQYIQQLVEKGYLENTGKKQGLIFAQDQSSSSARKIPLLGSVAAGLAVESQEIDDELEIPESMLGQGSFFALKIRGLSMIDDGILEDDIVVVEETNTAANGEIIVATINGESTVKRYFHKKTHIELKPANKTMKSIMVSQSDEFQIRGIVRNLIRKF